MSKTSASGVVGYVGSKEFKGRVYWSFKIDGDENWYRTGMYQPPCKKGDYINFEYETDNYGNQVNTKSIVVKEDNVAQQTPSKAVRSSSNKVGKDDYWANKEAKDELRQNVISFQAAHNTATAIVSAAVAHDILPLPSKKAEKFDAMVDAVRMLATDLYGDFMAVYEGKDPIEEQKKEEAAVDFSDMENFDDD